MVVSVVLCFSASAAEAANRYVRAGASGSGSGSDWTNAYVALPASLVRGDTYFIADGSYSGYTFDDAASGTMLLTIKKATESDHGTSVGWASTYGDGVAAFSGQLNFTTSNWVLDGQTGGGPGNWTSGFGFKVNVATAIAPLRVGAVNNISIRHIEAQGTLNNNQGGSFGQDGIAVYGGTNVTLSYYYLYDMGRCIFFLSTQDFIAEYGYTGRHVSSAAVHSELASIWNFAIPVQRVTFRYNVFTHVEGTGGIIFEGDDARIYGNVFYRPAGDTWEQGNGVIGTWTVNTLTNAKVYNNSFIVTGTNGPVFGSLYTAPTTGNEARNNVFYSVANVGLGGLFPTYSHNHYVSTTSGAETGKTTATGDPFVNFVGLDFRLKAPTAAGITLPSPYNVDMFGNVRGADGTWDRGAVEFGSVAQENPTVLITTPSASATYFTSITPLATVAGTAADGGVVVSCTGRSTQTGAFTIIGTTTWRAADIPLTAGDNVLTVSCTDDQSNVGSDVLTVTHTPPPATPIDSFTQPDGPLGSNWTNQTTNTISIVGSRAQSASGAPHMAFWAAHVIGANQFAQVTVRAISPNLQYAYVTCRATDTTSATFDHYQLNTDGASGNGHTHLNKIVDGVLSVLTVYPATFINGDVLRIECTGSGATTIKAFKNGQQIGSDYVDSNGPLVGGQPGIGLFGVAAASDDWQGGAIATAVAPPAAPTNLRIVK
jgi:hypothetical protein